MALYHCRFSNRRDATLPRRVAVSTDGDSRGKLKVAILAGCALPASMLRAVLAATALTDPAWLPTCLRAHQQRVHPYEVERYNGRSGNYDLRIRYARDPTMGDYPVGGSLHVSMYGKLNEGVDLANCDVPPLLASLYAAVPQEEASLELMDAYVAGTMHDAATEDAAALTALVVGAPAAPLEEQVRIDAALLHRLGACEDGITVFSSLYPSGVLVTPDSIAADLLHARLYLPESLLLWAGIPRQMAPEGAYAALIHLAGLR